MKTSAFFVRVWRVLSILGFVLALFSSYISYPDEVTVRFDDLNHPIQTINRETIFYIAIAIFIINNTLFNVLRRLFLRVPTDKIPVSNQDWISHRAKLNQVFTNWFSLLMSAINTILALGLMVLSFLNRSDRPIREVEYAWLLPLSTFILIAVLAYLPIRLFMKPGDDD
jgi:magnesium-transporting ATPase (P-type)